MHVTGNYTDQYQLTMAQSHFQKGDIGQVSTFDYFFRKLPFDGGYAVFAGLEVFLELLGNLRFTDSDITYLSDQGFDRKFIEYLSEFRFSGNIYSAAEGDIVFPTRPVLVVEAPIIEAQIIETLLLNTLNYQTLVATRASRMRHSAGNRTLIDFGMRRAHGPAACFASRAAIIGGFDSTSNVKAAMEYGIPVSGTMAHSFVQSFENEISAFRHFAKTWPDNCVLLTDTYNTLFSGVPNAITVAGEMESGGHRLKGIRLDSGDLAYLAKKSRSMLDDAGFDYVKIAASNQLDEYVIKSLLDQHAPIDVFGVGTSLVTGKPDAALDGVYKLSSYNGNPQIKLSENTEKINLPGKKQVHRIYENGDSTPSGDVVTLRDETSIDKMHHPFDIHKSITFRNFKSEPLLEPVMKDGIRTKPSRNVKEIAEYASERLGTLPLEYKRFDNPHIYKVGLSPLLKEQRDTLIKQLREN